MSRTQARSPPCRRRWSPLPARADPSRRDSDARSCPRGSPPAARVWPRPGPPARPGLPRDRPPRGPSGREACQAGRGPRGPGNAEYAAAEAAFAAARTLEPTPPDLPWPGFDPGPVPLPPRMAAPLPKPSPGRGPAAGESACAGSLCVVWRPAGRRVSRPPPACPALHPPRAYRRAEAAHWSPRASPPGFPLRLPVHAPDLSEPLPARSYPRTAPGSWAVPSPTWQSLGHPGSVRLRAWLVRARGCGARHRGRPARRPAGLPQQEPGGGPLRDAGCPTWPGLSRARGRLHLRQLRPQSGACGHRPHPRLGP
jgi:hypothetical protein